MPDNLKNKTVNGVFWLGIETFSTRFVSFFVSVILARILLPEEFGLLAMLTIFIALAGAVIDSGFGNALIQRNETTIEDECSVFYFNIFIAVVVYTMLFWAAPSIAIFYKEPQLAAIFQVTSLSLIIGSFSQVQSNLLRKKMNFKGLFKLSIIGNVSSGIVGVTMAYHGFGIWSLVVSSLTAEATRTIFIWFLCPWRPKLVFCFQSLRSLFGFGSKLLLSGLLDTFFVNVYGLLIGKFYSAPDLAFFNRGRSLPNLIVTSINGTIGSVMFPALSTIQDEPARMRRVVQRVLVTVAFILWPLLFGLTVVADPFIRILLTDKWLPAVPYLQVLCVAYALYPIHTTNLQVIKAVGRSDIFLKLEIIKKTLVTLNIAITLPHSIYAMLVGQVLLGCIGAFLNAYYTKQFIDYSFSKQLKDLVPIGLISTIMAGAIYTVGLIAYPNIYLQFTVQIFTGVIVYLSICKATKLIAFYSALELAMQLLKTKQKTIRPSDT